MMPHLHITIGLSIEQFPTDYQRSMGEVEGRTYSSLQVDEVLLDLVLGRLYIELLEAQDLGTHLHEVFEPVLLADHKLGELLLLPDLGLPLGVLEGVETFVVLQLVLLADVLLIFQQLLLFSERKSVEHARTPLNIMDVLLEGILGDYLAYEVPDLISLVSAQQYKPAGGVDMEEVHAVDHQILFGELKSKCLLPLLLLFLDDHAQ